MKKRRKIRYWQVYVVWHLIADGVVVCFAASTWYGMEHFKAWLLMMGIFVLFVTISVNLPAAVVYYVVLPILSGGSAFRSGEDPGGESISSDSRPAEEEDPRL